MIIIIMRKNSKQREVIKRIIKTHPVHPTAGWVYEQVKKEIPDIGLATVYRNLKLLKEEGEILELKTAGGTARFDGNTGLHYHFCCDRCGKIVDIEGPVDIDVIKTAADKNGLKVTHCYLELGGLCQECGKELSHQ